MQPGSCGKNCRCRKMDENTAENSSKNKTQEISGVESDHKNEIQVGRVEVPETIAYAIWKKLGIFAELTDELRQDARYLPVYELLYQIYRKTGYYDYVSSMPAGETPQGESGHAGREGGSLCFHQLQRSVPFCKIH